MRNYVAERSGRSVPFLSPRLTMGGIREVMQAPFKSLLGKFVAIHIGIIGGVVLLYGGLITFFDNVPISVADTRKEVAEVAVINRTNVPNGSECALLMANYDCAYLVWIRKPDGTQKTLWLETPKNWSEPISYQTWAPDFWVRTRLTWEGNNPLPTIGKRWRVQPPPKIKS